MVQTVPSSVTGTFRVEGCSLIRSFHFLQLQWPNPTKVNVFYQNTFTLTVSTDPYEPLPIWTRWKKLPLITFDLPQRWIKYELEHVHCKASEARYMLVEVLIMHFKGAILMMFIKVTIGLGDTWSTSCPSKLYHF